jgi:branched-chain amino acid transport system substrate-binding protein
MKKLLIATTASALIAGAVSAEDIKLGIVFGFTGPIESLTQPMASAAEMAMKEVTDSGALLGGSSVTSVRGDSTCIDSAAAVSVTERLVTADKVNGIVGGDCSGVTGAMLQNLQDQMVL